MAEEKKRVLVVDDEDDLTWSISKHLAKDKDKYELICVHSGKKALEVLSQLPVQLVISDIRMPEISGLDLLVKIKDFYPATKVIIMTAYGSSEVHDEANARGCFKYIEKPFEINELRKLILEGIEEKKGFRGTVTDFHLSDLIQMNCLGRMTSALYVARDDNKGCIYFHEGNVVHAECENMEGENALYEMLTWEGGNFTSERGKNAPKETIIKGWQSLLLEGMRRVDELQPVHKKEMEQKRDQTMIKIYSILDHLVTLKGVILATVFDPEGFPLASKFNEKDSERFSMNEVTPILSNLVKQVDVVGDDLKLDLIKDITLEFAKGIMIMTRIHERKEFLIVIAENAKYLSVIHVETKKYHRDLAKIL
jgi:CheY-like chemotaxis protein